MSDCIMGGAAPRCGPIAAGVTAESETKKKLAILGRNIHSIAYDLKTGHNIWCVPS